jgi:hypothetical protein
MTETPTPEPRPEVEIDVELDVEVEHGWLYDHIGRLSGIVLGLIAVAFLAFLASVGYEPALGLLVVVIVGIVLIILGGKMRGL